MTPSTLTLVEQLGELGIAHAPAMPLEALDAYLVPGVSARQVLSSLLQAGSSARAPLWIGRATDLPAWRALMEFATPLSVTEQMRLVRMTHLLVSQRVEVADVVEEMELPHEHHGVLERAVTHQDFLDAHARLLVTPEPSDTSSLSSSDLLLACAPDDRPESLLPVLGFGGMNTCPRPEEHMAILAYWQSLWGARLVACTPTRLEVQVLRRPQSWRDAFELAQEHIDYCPPLRATPQALKARANMLRSSHLWVFDWT